MNTSSFWSNEQTRWKDIIKGWIQENIDIESIEEINLILTIHPDLCIPETCSPVLTFKTESNSDCEYTILIRVEMSACLWKDFLFGASRFCKCLLKSAMIGFGFFYTRISVPYGKKNHYYSYVCFDMEFQKSEIKPPKQGTEEVIAH